MASYPVVVFVLSGKRKSGKDFVAECLQEQLGAETCVILRLSKPLKAQYAKDHGLDIGRLLDSSTYKEKYRGDMICWGEEQRARDPDLFCRLAIEQSNALCFPVWIVSDARRLTDADFFLKTFPQQTNLVRVTANEETRRARGWKFTKGIDDADSECGLDKDVTWNFVLENNDGTIVKAVQNLYDLAQTKLLSNAHV